MIQYVGETTFIIIHSQLTFKMSATIEEAGLGVNLEIPTEISNEKLWDALIIKIEKPQLMLPVTDVIHRVSDDGVGTYREMSVGPKRMIENIYSDKLIWEVVFKSVTGDTEIVNIINTNTATGVRNLEFFMRDSITKERIHWAAPKSLGLGGIQKTLELARSL